MIETEDWGLIDYEIAWNKQKEISEDIIKGKRLSVLAVCQHPSVITIGRNGGAENVLKSRSFLESAGIKVIDVDRGGDVTLHNPGQIVGYPIFDLTQYKQDLHWFLRELESVIIELLSGIGINSKRVEGLTGVWVEGRRKICAIGLHCSRWVTSHGFALNVTNDLNEFGYIVPCGISDKQVTSITLESGTEVDYNSIKETCIDIFRQKF